MRIFESFANALLEHGVNPLFGLMGDTNMVYVGDYLERGGRFVGAAHEASAVGMANAWSQATGEIGVATVTCGPGIANTFTSLVEAVKNRSRVLVLTGDAPLEPTHFQQLDIPTMVNAAGAGYVEVLEPGQTIRTLNRALQRVVAERRPIVMNLPQHMMMLEAGEQQATAVPIAPADAEARGDAVEEALALILGVRKPLILAGRGAVAANARTVLETLAERLGAPLATTVLAKDLFAGHPHNVGIFGNLSHSAGGETIGEADCIIAFGASLNAYTTFHGEITDGRRVVQIDADPAAFGAYIPVDAAVTGDADGVARALLALLDEAEHVPQQGWIGTVEKRLAARDAAAEFKDASTEEHIDVRTASIRLNEVLPRDRNVVSDIGRYVHAAWPHIAASDPRSFITMGAFGSVGLGLAGALGMAVARPEVPTVCVIGDGGFMMNPTELATAVRERMPLVVVLYDDAGYGFEWHKLKNFGSDPAHSLIAWPDLAGVARGLGADAVDVRSIAEIDALSDRLVNLTRPLVVVVKVDPTVDIVP
ncbi:thiamine pyrophosphate-binding protein [Brevibacterium album]|uniref:thiamine pyrophosphate-binding protein n=1 Tax=Brevibacterium album TaxID=417948 RepID=UPI0003F60630|nr:thiamine pyrophosphate-binding protein [Brevibacterium album]